MQDSASIKNIPSLNGYYRKVHFGFAAGRLNLSAAQIPECTDRKNFDAAELPYEYFTSLSDSGKKNLKKRFPILHCGNLLTPELTALILGAGKNIQQEFIRTCSRMFQTLAADGVNCGALDFSLMQSIQDDLQMRTISELLRKLHPVLLETGMTLLLPVRLPLPDAALREKLTAFLKDQMIAGLKLRLEIHPHELKPDFKAEDLAGIFRLETRSVIFCCNADSGNRLLRVHLTPWLRYFALTAFPGPYFFCPFSQKNRLAEIESESFSKLKEELNNIR